MIHYKSVKKNKVVHGIYYKVLHLLLNYRVWVVGECDIKIPFY